MKTDFAKLYKMSAPSWGFKCLHMLPGLQYLVFLCLVFKQCDSHLTSEAEARSVITPAIIVVGLLSSELLLKADMCNSVCVCSAPSALVCTDRINNHSFPASFGRCVPVVLWEFGLEVTEIITRSSEARSPFCPLHLTPYLLRLMY